MKDDLRAKKESLPWLSKNEHGATVLEYALIASCIAVVAIASVTFVGERTSVALNESGRAIAAGVVNPPPGGPGLPGG